MRFRFTKYLDTIENGDRIVLINKQVGSWIKISKECLNIIENAISLKCSEKELYDAFEEVDDRTYFVSLIKHMKKRRIIVNIDDKEEISVEDISIDFTNRCNLHCRHCLVSANASNDINITQQEFNTEELKDILHKVISLNPESITISGGEPLIRGDFFELCEELCSKYDGDLYLMTNGTLITKENAKQLTQIFKSISISLDGADETSSQILRDKGAFTKAVNAIKLLQSMGYNNISASMVETKPNQEYIPKFIKLCKKLNVYPMVRAFAAMGRGEKMKDIFSVRNDYCIEENLTVQYLPIEEKEQYTRQQISGVCSSAFGSFYMDAYGNIFPCASLCSNKYRYENIRNIDSLEQYIFEGKYELSNGFSYFKSQFPENDLECSRCNVRHFCWHCISQHLQMKLQDHNFKIWCQLQKENLSSIWNEEK